MNKSWIVVIVGVASSLLVNVARAADPAPAPVAAEPAPAPAAEMSRFQAPERAEWGTSWYLRGDIGWTRESLPQLDATLTYPGLTQQRQAWTGDLGLGYSINNWLRADVTYGTRQLQTWDGLPSMSHSEVLLNAYVDIGTWGGFTPFVGAGVGKGWRSAKNALGTFSESKVAWAGMIGVAFNLSESIKFDFGYRYLNTGKAVNAAIGYRRPFEAHELRIGVRYLFD